MKPDGLLGPNSCNIEPNSLHISCNVSYQGNISPMLQWREIRSLNNSINKGPYCRQTGFAVTCVVALKASFDLHGSSYVCETTASSTKRYNCSAGVVRVIRKKQALYLNDRIPILPRLQTHDLELGSTSMCTFCITRNERRARVRLAFGSISLQELFLRKQ